MKDVSDLVVTIGRMTIPFKSISEKNEFLRKRLLMLELDERMSEGLGFESFVESAGVVYPKADKVFGKQNYGLYFSVETPQPSFFINGLEIGQKPILHYRVYAGNSIKNSPDYDGNLEEYIQANIDRIVVRSFLTKENKPYYRFYLKKYK